MKTITRQKMEKRERRHKRIRVKIWGVSDRPRLAVFRSNRYLSAQIINDDSEKSLVSLSTQTLKEKGTASVRARILGKEMAKVAKEKGIKSVVFDRGGFIYMGSVKAFAEGAREGGLTF